MSVEIGTPFGSEMYDVGINPTHVQALVDDSSKIIRVDQESRFKFEDFLVGRDLIAELRDEYGVNVPRFDYILGWDPDRQVRAVYTVVDRVDGVEIWSLNQFRQAELPPVHKQFDLLCANLARYYCDKYGNDAPFFTDWHRGDFIYGRAPGDEEDKVYLVDIDPRFSRQEPKQETKESDRYLIRRHVHKIYSLVEEMERLLGNLRFEDARQELSRFGGYIDLPTYFIIKP